MDCRYVQLKHVAFEKEAMTTLVQIVGTPLPLRRALKVVPLL